MHNRLKRTLATLAGVAALAIGGAAIANAADSNSSSTTATATTTTPATTASPPIGLAPPGSPSMPAHGTASHEDAEKAVTGTAADKAKAAAIASVGSGTATEVTTDYQGSGYEVTVAKADGSSVEVHLDSSFAVMQHGPGGAPPSSAGTGA